MKFSLDRSRVDSKGREAALAELRKAAIHFEYRRFSRHEFDHVATNCKGTTVIRLFGSWASALDAIGTPLRLHKTDRRRISNADLLLELARVWRSLGHRPSKMEWEGSDARYSYTTYKQRFGGWVNACASLVAADDQYPTGPSAVPKDNSASRRAIKRSPVAAENKRTIPLKLRLKILSRDQFKCVLCGRTPAINPGAVLHVDHIDAFIRGGRTAEANLRTLCELCNWGKGSDDAARL